MRFHGDPTGPQQRKTPERSGSRGETGRGGNEGPAREAQPFKNRNSRKRKPRKQEGEATRELTRQTLRMEGHCWGLTVRPQIHMSRSYLRDLGMRLHLEPGL